jgi:hypothetical protein
LQPSCKVLLARQGSPIMFGWAVFPQDGENALSLYRAADERLYARKSCAVTAPRAACIRWAPSYRSAAAGADRFTQVPALQLHAAVAARGRELLGEDEHRAGDRHPSHADEEKGERYVPGQHASRIG